MWLSPVAPLLFLAAGIAADAGSPATPQPIATRQTEFGIPFTIQQPAEPARQPVEVRLFVSSDRGKTWSLFDRVEPSRKQFVCQAPTDGEYWFRLQTLDQSGQLRPAEPRPNESLLPGLVVIVDTIPPALQLEAHRGDAGQITARWTIEEPYLTPGTLTLQYRTTANGPWQKVALDQARFPDSGATQTGEVTWWVPIDSAAAAPSDQVQIRAEVTDTAGNPAVSHALVKLTRDTLAQNAEPQLTDPSPTQTATLEPTGPWRPSPSGQPPAEQPARASTNASFAHYPTAGRSGLEADKAAGPAMNATGEVSPYPATGVPESGGQPVAADPLAAASEGAPQGEAARDVRPKMVNSRQFELTYDDKSLGLPGTSRVELWGTRDDGKTWTSYALDDDDRSPMLASVEQDGIYGFRVVVQNNQGVGDPLPRSGDPPDVRIGVDMAEPTVQITAAQRGFGPDSNKLIVAWQADDWQLAARPVTLSIAEHSGGPWKPLAAGLENTGRYAWPIDAQTPERAYLRLEVRDEAGNVGTFETPQPVVLNQYRISAPIRDVRPLGR